MQIDEELNQQQDNEYTGREQVEGKRPYSQAARQSVIGKNTRVTREVDMSWADEVLTKLESVIEFGFDETEWHYAEVIEAFKDKEKLKKFITYKLQTKPAQHIILV